MSLVLNRGRGVVSLTFRRRHAVPCVGLTVLMRLSDNRERRLKPMAGYEVTQT